MLFRVISSFSSWRGKSPWFDSWLASGPDSWLDGSNEQSKEFELSGEQHLAFAWWIFTPLLPLNVFPQNSQISAGFDFTSGGKTSHMLEIVATTEEAKQSLSTTVGF